MVGLVSVGVVANAITVPEPVVDANIVLVTVPLSPVVTILPVVAGIVMVAVLAVLAPVSVIEPPLLA
jgi:hypothetical protein